MATHALSFLSEQKKPIDTYLSERIAAYKATYSHHAEAAFLFEHLELFVRSGKTVRGALFLEFLTLLGGADADHLKKYLPIAAAIELMHSMLLIQDDYMDADETRRGIPALHAVLRATAEQKNYADVQRYSASATMCATDVCFFMAWCEFTKVQLGPEKAAAFFEFLTKEYIDLSFSQWQDVQFGHMDSLEVPELSRIEQVYRYKTARYTFVMPILLAAQLSSVEAASYQHLEKASEALGMVFQITDDRLSIFGDAIATGKPVGSDITQNKKTFYYSFLFEALGEPRYSNFKHVQSYFGKAILTPAELGELKEALEVTGVNRRIAERIADYKNEFSDSLKKGNFSEEVSTTLHTVFEYIQNRTA